MEFNNIIKHFRLDGDFVKATPYGNGHINTTFLVETDKKQYVLQSINSNVFKKPDEVMHNIIAVTDHMRNKIIASGKNPEREIINFIPTTDGDYLFSVPEEGNYYRMYEHIGGAKTYDVVEEPVHFYNAAKTFGRFQNLLSDFNAEDLYETIPDFHNTRVRFKNFLDAIENDKAGRKKLVKDEIEFALSRADEVGIIVDYIENGQLTLRVTHNDTKLNNVLIDEATGQGICVLDLDTVMPGSMLFDYGDSLRFGTNPCDEDEKDLSKVYCDLNLFKVFTEGFYEELKDSITPLEIELMPLSAKMMTFECGIRFLEDYLNGDKYFRIHREGQNLDRCRTQFKLVADMEDKWDQMIDIVNEIVNR